MNFPCLTLLFTHPLLDTHPILMHQSIETSTSPPREVGSGIMEERTLYFIEQNFCPRGWGYYKLLTPHLALSGPMKAIWHATTKLVTNCRELKKHLKDGVNRPHWFWKFSEFVKFVFKTNHPWKFTDRKKTSIKKKKNQKRIPKKNPERTVIF